MLISFGIFILMSASLSAILLLVWHLGKRSNWIIPALLVGWGLSIGWAWGWELLIPVWVKGTKEAQTILSALPGNELVKALLAGGWFWPMVLLGIRASLECAPASEAVTATNGKAKGKCQQCGGAIESGPSELPGASPVVQCPHCGVETAVLVSVRSWPPFQRLVQNSFGQWCRRRPRLALTGLLVASTVLLMLIGSKAIFAQVVGYSIAVGVLVFVGSFLWRPLRKKFEQFRSRSPRVAVGALVVLAVALCFAARFIWAAAVLASLGIEVGFFVIVGGILALLIIPIGLILNLLVFGVMGTVGSLIVCRVLSLRGRYWLGLAVAIGFFLFVLSGSFVFCSHTVRLPGGGETTKIDDSKAALLGLLIVADFAFAAVVAFFTIAEAFGQSRQRFGRLLASLTPAQLAGYQRYLAEKTLNLFNRS